MTERVWRGARWWRFDFHTHTPASDDYGKGPEHETLQAMSPNEWLLGYMRAGIDCVAITDHNTGEWVDRVKDALSKLEADKPEGFRKLHVFPGMEISVQGGIHLLAIFDPSTKTADLDALRGAVKYQGNPGKSDGVTLKSFVDVVGEVIMAQGIAIPAHADKERGLFELTGETLQQALDCEGIFAMELVCRNFQKPQLYSESKRKWTEVLGSDAHHPGGGAERKYPGSRSTWVKMGSPDIEGLRLALRDGALSVRRFDQAEGDPNRYVHSVIEDIEISEARYIGRTESFKQEFNPWLNAVIGGRGTGKSTLVEFLRLALRREKELPEDLQAEFAKYGRAYADREDGGLLTGDAVIKVIYRKADSQYRIQWCPVGDLEPIEQFVDGEWQPASGDIQQRFPVRIYSQKQVFQLAKAPRSLLRVVDEAHEVDRRSWLGKWKKEESSFLSLRAEARRIQSGLGEETRLRGELDDVKQKLDVFEREGHADVLKAFQKRRRQQRAVETWEESWSDTGDRVRETAAAIVPDIPDEASFDSNSAEDKALMDYAAQARSRLDKIRAGVEIFASQVDEAIAEWRKNKDESSWKRNVDAALQAYEDLKSNLAREGAGDPAEYGQLVQHMQNIEQQLKDLKGRRNDVDELKKKAVEQLQKLVQIRRELTGRRKEFLTKILNGNRYVQIDVIPYGARETVESEFRDLLQRGQGGFEKDIGSPDGEGLLGKLYKNGDRAEDVERGLADIKSRIMQIASNTHDPGSLADRRFASHIQGLQPEVFDRLDLWFPEDSLKVRYSTAGDGRRFRSIEQGSPGQKTAALLAFLLSYGEEPLILDQPEDDLDNHLIYDLIVNQLREVKRRRQVIVVTHNANIVVNGDAELVTALDVRGGLTQKECEGSLQEEKVRDTICTIMEGGREAFDERYRRIALEGSHV